MLNLHYIAGIVDGEGWIGLSKHKDNRMLSIAISVKMVNKAIPTALYDQFGGSLYLNKRMKEPTKKPVYEWKIGNAKAIGFLTVIAPLLIIKKPQAFLVLQYYNVRNECSADGHQNIKDVMTELNRRGKVS